MEKKEISLCEFVSSLVSVASNYGFDLSFRPAGLRNTHICTLKQGSQFCASALFQVISCLRDLDFYTWCDTVLVVDGNPVCEIMYWEK